MANSFDVAIVGGGVIGWSSAWHLLHRAPSLKVAIIDSDASRCTSLRGAGGVRAQFSSDVNIGLSLLSIEEFKNFPQEVGADIGYRQNGYLLFTADPDRAARMRQAADYQRDRGVVVSELSVPDLKAKVPCLKTNDVVYAHIGVQDGYLDGPAMYLAYKHAAKRLGACEVQSQAMAASAGIVQTRAGDIAAPEIVLAPGHWSGGFMNLSVKPEKHQLYFANVDNLDHSWPFVIDADTTFHFRPHGHEIIVCFNDPALSSQQHEADDSTDYDARVLDHLLPIAEQRAPGFLSRDRIVNARAGFYAVTPDRHPILGPKDGVFVATGFGGHGIMHSPAAGRLVAEMVLDGEAKSLDIRSLAPDRFERGKLVEETFVF